MGAGTGSSGGMTVVGGDDLELGRINGQLEEAASFGEHTHRHGMDAREHHMVLAQVLGLDVEAIPLLLKPLDLHLSFHQATE